MIRGFQSEILFSESDWHLGPFWSHSWTPGPSLMLVFTNLKLLFFCFLVSNSMADPPVIGMIVPKVGKAFEF
jgi:hypothetical protein